MHIITAIMGNYASFWVWAKVNGYTAQLFIDSDSFANYIAL